MGECAWARCGSRDISKPPDLGRQDLKGNDGADNEENSEGRQSWSPELDAGFTAIEAERIPGEPVEGEWNFAKRSRVARSFDLHVAWLSETENSHATQSSGARFPDLKREERHARVAQIRPRRPS